MSASPAPGFRYSGKARHRMGYDEVKRLAEAYGLPGDAIAQIAKGESGMYADVQQKDPGDGMVGYGLLQMTPNAWGKGSAAYKHMQSLGGIEAMKDPNKNMAMARFLYKSAGNKLTPWYGTKFLTNRSGEGKLGPVDPNLAKGAGGSPVASPKTTTTPGTPADTQARNSAILDYFKSGRGKPGALVALKGQLDAAKAVPGVDVASTPSGSQGGSQGGSQSTFQGGGALADTVIQRVSQVDKQHLPYKWGGGHGGKIHPKQGVPVDCSGFISEVLGVNPRVASQFKKFGNPGEGGDVTIYAKDTHVLAKVRGKDGKWHFFGTSASNPGGGAGWIEAKKISPQYLKGFTARHV